MLAVLVVGCVLIYGVAEGAMISQFGPDAQIPIWMAAYVTKILFWLMMGLGIVWLATLRRPRGILAAPLLVVWTLAVLWSSSLYWQGWKALVDAADPQTSAERLTELAHFRGAQAGYELDNRIAAHRHTPPSVLRELHGRKDQLGTEMSLAANPHTPTDILRELSRDDEPLIRRQLAVNPALDYDLIVWLQNDGDREVRERLATTPHAGDRMISR
jgi:hypothetical protein